MSAPRLSRRLTLKALEFILSYWPTRHPYSVAQGHSLQITPHLQHTTEDHHRHATGLICYYLSLTASTLITRHELCHVNQSYRQHNTSSTAARALIAPTSPRDFSKLWDDLWPSSQLELSYDNRIGYLLRPFCKNLLCCLSSDTHTLAHKLRLNWSIKRRNMPVWGRPLGLANFYPRFMLHVTRRRHRGIMMYLICPHSHPNFNKSRGDFSWVLIRGCVR